MKCPACQSEIADLSYRCKECRHICSYPRLIWRYRLVVFAGLFIILLSASYLYAGRFLAPSYADLDEGSLVSETTTRKWLGLSDGGWFLEEPHHKGTLLHLRHKVFQTKDVIVFIHGFIGNYVDTWGKPTVLLDDPRFNRNYDFVFYGFKTALFGDVNAFKEEAYALDRELIRLEENYKTVTLVTHSKGGLLAMRTLLNRAMSYPRKPPYKLHRIVMFAPLTENVSLDQHPDIVDLLSRKSMDIRQMQANTYSELGQVKADLSALLEAKDAAGEERKHRFLKEVVDRLYVINAENDKVVDIDPKGEKTISESLRKLSEQPTLGAPRVVTLRYNDIGGPEEDNRLLKRAGVKNPAYAHTAIVKMGEQTNFAFFNRFEELLFDRIGTPPRQASIDTEQIRQNLRDKLDEMVFAMNRFVVEKEPMVGLCWSDINDAVSNAVNDEVDPDKRQSRIETLTKQVYYVYIFLDMYAKMDDLRSRGLLSANDEKLVEWKTSWLPKLVGSGVGKWMLDHDLTSYYSEQMNKDLKEAAASYRARSK